MDWSEVFHYYWTEIADSRTADFSMIYSIYKIPLMTLVYSAIIYLGPRFMKNRQPHSLKTFIKIYNLFQIVINAWLVQKHLAAGWLRNIPFTCMPINYSYEPRYYNHIEILWWALLSRLIDWTETIVFILRKKNNQVSELHVYHHISSVVLIWICLKYYPNEMSTFPTLVNSSVHVLMYTYYLFASYGPRIQAILSPYKSYITILQMVQFFILIIYSMQTFLPSCEVPKIMGYIFLVNVLINWYMFYKFYKKTYILPKTSKVKR